jgi:hypothetical protein
MSWNMLNGRTIPVPVENMNALKVNDHVLDCVEHVLSRHPRAATPEKPRTFIPPPGSVQWMGNPLRKKKKRQPADSHLGGM